MAYRTYDECMAGEKSFLPKQARAVARSKSGAASAAAAAEDNLPRLLLPRTSDPRLQAAGSCPPATAAGCQDYARWSRWEQLFPSSGPSTDIIVPAGQKVVLFGCAQPANTVNVRSITIPEDAVLAIADSPLMLQFSALLVMGTFEMGSASCPVQSGIQITVPGGAESNGIDVMETGRFDVHGFMQGLTWTRVSKTVLAGSNLILLQEPVQWQAGEDILLVTTIWKDELSNQNEVLRILSVSVDGRIIRTRQLIQYNHYGGEYQAEVALLSRRILFTTDDASLDGSGFIGPHTTFRTADARVSGAAFQKWGSRNIGGRYPLHFHLVGETSNAYLKNNVIYRSNWRCVTIHATNGVHVYGNVGFDVHGHCYYLEDGVEERNILERNLAAYIHAIQLAGFGEQSFASADLFDPTDVNAAGFYALNKYNTWLNNAASGGVSGFSFPAAPRPIKESKNTKAADGVFPLNPSTRPFVLFKGNSAHSSGGAFVVLEDVTTALCATGVAAWRGRTQINNMKAYDVNIALQLLHIVYINSGHFKINTTNSALGWSGWPYTSARYSQESFPIIGFRFYDAGAAQVLNNITFENYQSLPDDHIGQQPRALRYASWSDKFKPAFSQAVTKQLRCINCSSSPGKNGFFQVEPLHMGSNLYFTMFDMDGSVVRAARPDKPAGPYLIGSYPKWWSLGPDSWQEVAFNGAWINPMPAKMPDCELVGRLDLQIVSKQNNWFTVPTGVRDADMLHMS
eukprot:gene7671-7873_t